MKIYSVNNISHNEDVQSNKTHSNCNAGVKNFTTAFLFAMETSQTIIYGTRYPDSEFPDGIMLRLLNIFWDTSSTPPWHSPRQVCQHDLGTSGSPPLPWSLWEPAPCFSCSGWQTLWSLAWIMERRPQPSALTTRPKSTWSTGDKILNHWILG